MSFNRLKIYLWSCLLCFTFSQIALAKKQIKLVLPDDGSFVIKKGILHTNGRGVLHYGEYTIQSDFIQMNRNNGNVHFFGNVSIEGENRIMKTLYVDYNTKTKKGFTGFLKGEVSQENNISAMEKLGEVKKSRDYFFTAMNADLLVNESGEPKLLLINPTFSDCDSFPPHHDLTASTAEFSSKEGIKMWNIRPRMFRVPYFYFPFIYKDLKYDWPWTKWEIGSKSEWGRFLKVKTNALPKPLNEGVIVGYEYRELRGNAYTLDFKRSHHKYRSEINLHHIDEDWKTQNSEFLFEEKRMRFDLKHDHKISENLNATIEHHVISAPKNHIWSHSGQHIVNKDRYASPLPGATQIRDTLLQEYYEDEFKHGKRLENILALDYQGRQSFFSLSRVAQIDNLSTDRLIKEVSFKGFLLPAPILNTDFYYSNNFGFDSFHLGPNKDLSVNDRQLLFGKTDISKFYNQRVNFEQQLEYVINFGQFLTFTPSIGQRSVYYKKSLKEHLGSRNFANVDEKTDIEEWQGSDSAILGALFSNTVKGYFGVGKHEVKHLIRPSIDIKYNSPSSFNSSRLVNSIDSLDTNINSRLKVIYRLGNEVLSKRKGKEPRMIYSSSLNFDTYLKREDRKRAFGQQLTSDGDVELTQQIYPFHSLRLSSDIKYNSFYKQIPVIRMGMGVNRKNLDFAYNYYYIKSILLNPDSVNRHDFTIKYDHRQFDTRVIFSVEEDPFIQKSLRAGLYKRGVRNLDIVLGRLFHCIRGEVNFKYDIESAGSTLIFSIGPKILGDSLPKYRHPLKTH